MSAAAPIAAPIAVSVAHFPLHMTHPIDRNAPRGTFAAFLALASLLATARLPRTAGSSEIQREISEKSLPFTRTHEIEKAGQPNDQRNDEAADQCTRRREDRRHKDR
ncbi:hypothetical protein OG204_14915 [Streptomyces sp. NBC_01387]|uniref:hypothetical protein n=1 Tax=unclassified Streptomyces TaxID=2593676 RepID=UPI0020254864|nr:MULTISPECIES: hypothetical protein [unclassified Streptomyces]WSC24892.1 hypothetical protein OIE60_20260 [Streptomyces sp. NBC_01766]